MGGKFRRSSNEFRFAFVNLDLLEFHLGKFVRLTKKKKSPRVNHVWLIPLQLRHVQTKQNIREKVKGK